MMVRKLLRIFFLKEIVFLRLRVSEPNSQVYIASKALNPVFYKSFPRKIFNRLLKIHPNYKNNLKSIFLSDCSKPNSLPFPFSKTRSEEHTSELQSRENLVCRLLLEKKKK